MADPGDFLTAAGFRPPSRQRAALRALFLARAINIAAGLGGLAIDGLVL